MQDEDGAAEFFTRVGSEHRVPIGRADQPEVTEGRARSDGPHRAWAESDGTFWGVARSHKTLPAGLYRVGYDDRLSTSIFMRMLNVTDDIVTFPDGQIGAALDEVRAFIALRSRFLELGLLYKRGMMFYGPPGSGKTCTVQMIVRLLQEAHDAVCIFSDGPPRVAVNAMQALRRVESNRLIAVVLEDLDALCETHGESAYLSMMDGEAQVGSVIFICTTNYPERLDPRFVDRPSRIDSIRYIGMPSETARRAYFEAKLVGSSDVEITDYVVASDGYSAAYMRELIVQTKGFARPLADAKELIDSRRQLSKNVSSKRGPDEHGAGFTNGRAPSGIKGGAKIREVRR